MCLVFQVILRISVDPKMVSLAVNQAIALSFTFNSLLHSRFNFSFFKNAKLGPRIRSW